MSKTTEQPCRKPRSVLTRARPRPRRVRVAVMHGEAAVHLDTIEIDNARSRAAFLTATEQRAEALGIELNRVRIENALLQDAMRPPLRPPMFLSNTTAARSWEPSGSTCSARWTTSPSCAGYPTPANAGGSRAPQTGKSKRCSRRWAGVR